VEAALVSGVGFSRGLGRLAGLDVLAIPPPNGDPGVRYGRAVEQCMGALDRNEVVFVAVEEADESGHLGDARGKVEAIERFDDGVVGPVLAGLRARGGEWRVLVLPDHPTPCAQRTHTSDPVPFLVYVSRDEAKARGQKRGYHEKDAREHGIFIPEAHGLMSRLLRA